MPPQNTIIAADSPNLDLLRSIAVMLVLVNHFLETHSQSSGYNLHPHDWHLGRIGVLLFFVHTSLVLMMSLDRTSANGRKLFQNFYIRRAFRIYPLSIFCVLLVYLVGIPQNSWTTTTSDWPLETIFSNLLLTQNLTYDPSILSPLWSLPLELQMYVMLPFLYSFLKVSNPLRLVAGFIAISIILGLLQPHISGRLNVFQFVPCFLGGVLAWQLSKTNLQRTLSWVLWPVFILSLVLIYLLIAQNLEKVHPPWLAWLLCLVLGGSIVRFGEIPRDGLTAKLSTYIARYSYGIYLFHMIALWIGFRHLSHIDTSLQWSISIGIILVMPVLMYHLLELPMIRVGNKVARHFTQSK